MINAEFQILFHPQISIKPVEVYLVYTLTNGKNWETYLANKITPLNWGIGIYDLKPGQQLEFFLRVVIDDGRMFLIKKNRQNYKVIVRDNTNQGRYKAQVRVTEDLLMFIGRKCLICDETIPKNKNMCETEGCNAVYCPQCNRMLPPFSNYCPWDKIFIDL